MQTRILGKTGFDVSILGFGSAPAAFLNPDESSTVAMLNMMLDAGVNVLDTAAMYPGSEEFIGRHLSHRRDDYVLVSKCGTKVADLDASPWSADLIRQTLDRALARMKTDSIDVMLLHSCDLATLQRGEALGELLKARDAGKVKFVGYSGDNDTAAHAAALPDVAAIETSINVVDQINIDKVLPAAAQHNVGIIAKRPIANAAWKDIDQQPGMYKNYAKDYTQRLAQLALSPADLGFAGDAGKAWAEIAIRFTLSFPEVGTAIIGTTNPANAMANLGYVEKGVLPTGVIERIRSAFRLADPRGNWKGLT